jgi:predicted Holliday junction resolvase-like endonuclease
MCATTEKVGGAEMIAEVSGSLIITFALAAITIIGAIVLIYLYTISKVRQGTAALQEQAGVAQSQIIEALQATQEKQAAEIKLLRSENNHLTHDVNRLEALVTQAAKVDALRDTVEGGFSVIVGKLDAALAR